MTFAETISLLPIIVPAAMAVVILLVLAIRRNHALTLALTLAGLIVSVGLVVFGETESVPVTTLLVLDGYARFFIGLIMAQTAAVALLSYGYLARRGGMVEEYYVLLLLAAVGAAVLAASTHFASFFLGLETLSVPLYTLIGYHRRGELSVEAAFKYLVLAATAASMLLFGMAMVYADLGRLQFAEAAMRLADLRMAGSQPTFVLTAGMVLIIIGIAFKLALAPLHLWTPDVYQGAPAPVTAFVATVSKGAMFALLLRLFTQVDIRQEAYGPVLTIFVLLAVVSMFAGNLLALMQSNVKRILAYSSIAHMGYLLVAFLASGDMAVTAAALYLLAYFITTSGAFGVVAALSDGGRDADGIEDYRGLAWRRPVMAAVFAAMLLSLAGIPLTAGFVGKFYLVAAGAQSSLWTLVVILVANSAIGLYYYLRIIAAMYMRLPEEDGEGGRRGEGEKGGGEEGRKWAAREAIPLTAVAALTALVFMLLWLGVYPAPFIEVIQSMGMMQ